jgi:uncharacterized protein
MASERFWLSTRGLTVSGRLAWRRMRRFTMHYVLHADDPPARIALGAAIGMFIMFTPTVGVQMGLVVFFAWLVGANKAAGLPVVWISNPATIVPIYWLCYEVGCFLLQTPRINQEWWAGFAHPPSGWTQFVQFYWTRAVQIGWPLWVGGCVVGIVFSLPTYYLVYWLIYRYRMQRWGQLSPPARKKSKDPGDLPRPRTQPSSPTVHP